MPLNDDGDLIRGLGFVALYAAYLEEAIDDCVEVLVASEPVPDERIFRWQTSRKIDYIRERLTGLTPLPAELLRFERTLTPIADLLEERNLVIHGRIYASPGAGDILKSARRGLPDQPASSKELYALANDLFSACAPFQHASMFSLRRHLATIGTRQP